MPKYIDMEDALSILREDCGGCCGKEMGWCEKICRSYVQQQKIRELMSVECIYPVMPIVTKADAIRAKLGQATNEDLAELLGGEDGKLCQNIPMSFCNGMDCDQCAEKWLALKVDDYDGVVW